MAQMFFKFSWMHITSSLPRRHHRSFHHLRKIHPRPKTRHHPNYRRRYPSYCHCSSHRRCKKYSFPGGKNQ